MKRQGQTGVTLVNVLITAAIASILAVVAIPGFKGLMKSVRIRNAEQRVMAMLVMARREALRQGKSVRLCRTDTGTVCQPSSTTTPGHNGLLLYADLDGNSSYTFGQDSALTTFLPHGDLWPRYIGGSGFRWLITFDARGRSFSAGTLYFCADNDPKTARGVIVHASGRLSFARDSDGDGVREDHNGVDLSCS